MILYHGSEKIIRQPRYHGGKAHNDYGYGFYCTESADLAREWSVEEARDGFCNRYRLEREGLNILRLNGGGLTVLHWLTVLLENREFALTSPLAREGRRYLLDHFSVPYREADVCIGYRADDSYFSFAQDFLNGTISVQQLSSAMMLGKLGEQVVLISRRSYEHIVFEQAEEVPAAVWYARRYRRDHEARERYFSRDRRSWQRGELYLVRLLDEEVKADDERIPRLLY